MALLAQATEACSDVPHVVWLASCGVVAAKAWATPKSEAGIGRSPAAVGAADLVSISQSRFSRVRTVSSGVL